MLLNPFFLERAYLETRRSVPKELGVNMRERHFNALKKAFERLIENPYIYYENGRMLVLTDSVTEKGEPKFYRASKTECRLVEPANFLCYAFWEGFPCWHRATLKIVDNYLLIEDALNEQKSQKLSPESTRKVSPA